MGTLRPARWSRRVSRSAPSAAAPTTETTTTWSFSALTATISLVCVAYNVAAPVTISKIVEGSTPKGPFALTVSCGDGESTSYENHLTLDDGGSQKLWLPYDTDCTLVETATGGADETSFSVNGEAAGGEPRERGRPDPRLHHAWHRGQRGRRDFDRRDQHRRVGRPVADQDRHPRHRGAGRAGRVPAHGDQQRSRWCRWCRADRHAAERAHLVAARRGSR